jgi:hypothetical protein
VSDHAEYSPLIFKVDFISQCRILHPYNKCLNCARRNEECTPADSDTEDIIPRPVRNLGWNDPLGVLEASGVPTEETNADEDPKPPPPLTTVDCTECANLWRPVSESVGALTFI